MRLSEKERMALVFIKEYPLTYKRAPGFRQVGDAVGWSSSATVQHHMNRLQRGGYVDWERGIPNSLRVTEKVR